MTTLQVATKAGIEDVPGLDLIIKEIDGVQHWVFNPQGSGGEITLREFEAGRVANGLRRFQHGDVNTVEPSINAENDPNLKYQYNRRTHETVEMIKAPTLNGMHWRSTGREDPGFTTELGGRKFPHQITSAMAAILFAVNDAVIQVPVSDRYAGEVTRQGQLAQMNDAERAAAIKAFKEERQSSNILY